MGDINTNIRIDNLETETAQMKTVMVTVDNLIDSLSAAVGAGVPETATTASITGFVKIGGKWIANITYTE